MSLTRVREERHTRTTMRTTTALAATVLTAVLAGCTPATVDAGPTAQAPTAQVEETTQETVDEVTAEPVEETVDEVTVEPVAGDAMEALYGLRVVAHDIAPYDREDFGGRWVDFDGTGCTSRQDVLRRDATEWVDADGDCQPEQLVIQDRFTGSAFVALSAADIDIDHVVSIHDAWLTGAQQWEVHDRVAFYQDKLNLVAVEGSVNRSKSNLNAAQWLPPYEAGRCEFAARQVSVKAKWDLGVTDAEQVALADVLATCPGQPLLDGTEPTPVFDPTPYLTGGQQDKPVNPAPVAPQPETSDGGEVHYENCDAVRAAGAAPIHRGEPGYRAGLDRDGDGVGCQ